MEESNPRISANKCVTISPLPKTLCVQQVLGEKSTQESIDIHVVVPRRKPAIEQIIDVFIKRLRITDVNVVPDKVIVRGDFEMKAIYVACLPRQPVHAVEVQHVRFSTFADIPGARRCMEADANVMVEFVDYDCDKHSRAHWYKKNNQVDCNHHNDWEDDDDYCDDDYEDDCDDDCHPKHHPKHKGHCNDDCEEDYEDDCHPKYHPKHKEYCDDDYDDDDGCYDDCHDDCHDKKHKSKCKPDHCKPCKPCKKPKKCSRRFDVAVVLRITVKVFNDREIVLYTGGMPLKPKG